MVLTWYCKAASLPFGSSWHGVPSQPPEPKRSPSAASTESNKTLPVPSAVFAAGSVSCLVVFLGAQDFQTSWHKGFPVLLLYVRFSLLLAHEGLTIMTVCFMDRPVGFGGQIRGQGIE